MSTVEQGSFSEEYSRLSPLERNREFRRLYDTCPPNYYIYLDKAFNEEGHLMSMEESFAKQDRITTDRLNSAEFKETMSKLDSLLQFSETTATFREFFVFHFHDWYLAVVMKEPKDHSFIAAHGLPVEPLVALETEADHSQQYIFLLTTDPQDGGIFDPQLAKELEQRVYHVQLASLLGIDEPAEELKGSFLGVLSLKGLKTPQIFELREHKLLKKWREEYIEKYGDEP